MKQQYIKLSQYANEKDASLMEDLTLESEK